MCREYFRELEKEKTPTFRIKHSVVNKYDTALLPAFCYVGYIVTSAISRGFVCCRDIYNDRKNGRSLSRFFSMNVYLSSENYKITQNYQ